MVLSRTEKNVLNYLSFPRKSLRYIKLRFKFYFPTDFRKLIADSNSKNASFIFKIEK